MNDRIKESDWKIFRRVHQAALERFCDGVLAELQYYATDREMNSHQRYLKIYEIIQKRDKKLAIVFDGKSRSKAVMQLAGLRHHGLVTDEEFAEFSEETRDEVTRFLRIAEL
jgi:hypothetical protein